MKMIVDIKDGVIYAEYGIDKYMIKREYIGGTSIINYWLYGCYGTDDYEYFINSYGELECALQEIKERGENLPF